MSGSIESTDRNPTDYFHFAAVFFGIIFGAAGIVTVSAVLGLFGALLIALGLAYFLVDIDY